MNDLLYKSKLKVIRNNNDGTFDAIDNNGKKWERCDEDGCLNTDNFSFVLYQNEQMLKTPTEIKKEMPKNTMLIAFVALGIGLASIIAYQLINKKK